MQLQNNVTMYYYYSKLLRIEISNTMRKTQKSGVFNGKLSSNNKRSSKQDEQQRNKIIIKDQFIIKYALNITHGPINSIRFRAYKGIDLISRKFVIVYIWPYPKDNGLNKTFKQTFKQKLCPPCTYSGMEKIQNKLLDIEVHKKYGPNLLEIMKIYNKKISEKTLYTLAYHLLKIIDRIDSIGYSMRTLSPKNVIFHQNYMKNDIYLLNLFDLQRKGEKSILIPDPKYCSISCHLKIKVTSKDMAESICYILMDFYLGGNLFSSVNKTKDEEYLEAKSTLNPDFMPYPFIQFYYYVKNLNYLENIKFSEWKIYFKKFLTHQELYQSYEWIKIDPETIKNNSLFRGMLEISNQNTLQFSGFNMLEKLTSVQQDTSTVSKEDEDWEQPDNFQQIDEYDQEQQNLSIHEKIGNFDLQVKKFSNTKKYI